MQTIRFGVIGTGGIARRFAQGLSCVPGAKLVTVWNRGAGKAQAFAADFDATACGSVEALLASDIDAVYIGTPHTSHAPYSIAAMRAGHAVLCEKPVAVSLSELETVLAVARETGCLFMEAMKPPFYPLFRKLDEHLGRDPIGAIRYVRAGFANPNVPAGHVLFDPAMAGGSL
ncbi:MAG TPA: Gfo/Idh/MocA family oxidoreductase, partial [Chitinolyticbacter sp.]|nr:Gfo/Idh/MocA family oxidoreductase [Chitinolyticbacter sp.]